MIVQATIFETLRVLHNLWKGSFLETNQVMKITKEHLKLELTVLTNGEIKAESSDGKERYAIKTSN